MSVTRCVYFLEEVVSAYGPDSGFLTVWKDCPVYCNDIPSGMLDVPECWPHSIAELSRRLDFRLIPIQELDPDVSVYTKVDEYVVWLHGVRDQLGDSQ